MLLAGGRVDYLPLSGVFCIALKERPFVRREEYLLLLLLLFFE